MTKRTIALVSGDGSAPEMMHVACAVAKKAALLDDIEIVFEETPMGWNALERFGHTCPETSLARIQNIGLVFFGGVGDPKLDETIGVQRPELKPETAALLALRKRLGLVVNVRPVVITEDTKHLSRLKFGKLPDGGLQLICHRLLNEDTYFGTADLRHLVPPDVATALGLKLKSEVTGDEGVVAELSYYSRANLLKYFRAAFELARQMGLPVISLDKANIMARYAFWRKLIQRVHDEEFPDVPLRHQLIDSANALLLQPEKLHGVGIAGNEQGDTFTDGVNGLLGLGLMHSYAFNPSEHVSGSDGHIKVAMYESGAGVASDIAGRDIANPIGRILTARLMLDHIGAPTGAKAIKRAFDAIIHDGWRTLDMFAEERDDSAKLVGTKRMGELFLEQIAA